MPMYRTPDGHSWMHLNLGRGKPILPCAAMALETDNTAIGPRCCRPSSKLCDAEVGTTLRGDHLTCDMPLCDQHATSVGPDRDYCPRHIRTPRSAGAPPRMPDRPART